MLKSNHTPGQWISRPGTSTGFEVVGKKPRGGDYIVARCGGGNREGNARLIATAPEMLSTLHLVGMSAGWQYLAPETQAIITALILKAEGAV